MLGERDSGRHKGRDSGRVRHKDRGEDKGKDGETLPVYDTVLKQHGHYVVQCCPYDFFRNDDKLLTSLVQWLIEISRSYLPHVIVYDTGNSSLFFVVIASHTAK